LSLTFTSPGTDVVLTLTDDLNQQVTGSLTVNVLAPPVAAPTQFQLQLPPTTGAANGVPEGALITIMAMAEDSSGNLVPFNGTATLSISGGTAIFGNPQIPGPVFLLPVDVTFVGGVAQLPLTFTSVGTDLLTLTDDLNPKVTGSLKVNVLGPSGPPTTGGNV
jgi:hypothetical protein